MDVSAVRSLVIGILAIVLTVCMLIGGYVPALLFLVIPVMGIIHGIKGIGSPKRMLAIIGIILNGIMVLVDGGLCLLNALGLLAFLF